MCLGLYIHIPFCVKKCKYCDFVSFDNRSEYTAGYIDAVINEMKEYAGERADTVFIGGGTPTVLADANLEKLLDAVNKFFKLSGNCEFTVEANPGTVTEHKLSILKNGGANRLSIGVQSFSNDELKKIGRIHDAAAAQRTIDMARECGFDNISIDLMSSLPGQTMQSFSETLNCAISKNPEHISCYSLILEENTPLYDEYAFGSAELPDEDSEREMYDYACDFLSKNGYNQYEISNFAKPGKESLHNIKYWKCMEYIGIGLAAHSYYKGKRFFNTSDLKQYLSGEFHSPEVSYLTVGDKIEEFMIMGLRMNEGVKKSEFKSRFGYDMYELFKDVIERFTSAGFLCDNGESISLTHKGIAVSNSILCEFTDFNIKKID